MPGGAKPRRLIAPFGQAVARLDEIPGIAAAAAIIIAEVGLDMSRFPRGSAKSCLVMAGGAPTRR